MAMHPGGTPARLAGAAAAPRLTQIARPLLIGLVAVALVAALGGGLLRAGWAPASDHAVFGRAALAHAALMILGFFSTVVAIERAVAVKRRAAFVGPFASGLAAALQLAGHGEAAAWLWVASSAAFIGVGALVLRRQAAAHTVLLFVAALALAVGNVLHATSWSAAALPWWFAFLVLTIAAERLELTRLTRRHAGAQPALFAIVALLLAAAAASAAVPAAGGVAYGVALTLLAVWLGVFDIARRTALSHGLSRYMALCLMCGYLWLGIGGVAWAALSLGLAARDLALHALGLGFIFSMVMGHAPVILPAVAQVKLRFGAWFYAPLVLLHASLALRVLGGLVDPAWQRAGAALNAAALALFALTVIGSALAYRSAARRAATRLTPH